MRLVTFKIGTGLRTCMVFEAAQRTRMGHPVMIDEADDYNSVELSLIPSLVHFFLAVLEILTMILDYDTITNPTFRKGRK